MRLLTSLPVLFFVLIGTVSAQFGFFEQMFNGGQQQHNQAPQNVPSDSTRYRNSYDQSHCDKYLCPDTLGMINMPLLFAGGNGHLHGRTQLAYTTRTIARVRGLPTRTSSSWLRGRGYACQKAGSRLARRRGRLSLLGKGCFERWKGFSEMEIC